MKFIIYAPKFDPNSGGNSVLYALGRLLRQQGIDAYIWVDTGHHYYNWSFVWLCIRRLVTLKFVKLFRLFSQTKEDLPFELSLASHSDLTDAVVIYPEVVSGNPLNSKKVVRWLLNKPGELSAMPEFGSRDLFFYYNEIFNDPNTYPFSHRLKLGWVNKSYYKQENFGPRSGVAYIVRKGAARELNQHPSDAICIDGKSHEELNTIFNQVEYLYSYDLYCAYTTFAAYCGCIPIVIPQDGMSAEEWLPDPIDRYGIAYGESDVPRAIATRNNLLEFFRQLDIDEQEEVKQFIQITQDYFG